MARGAANNLEARLTELEVRLARSEKTISALRSEVARKDGFILFQQDRIDELVRSLEEVRRAGKRQAAPFSKGNPKETPKRSGRKSGDKHGRHGHRRVPEREPDRTLDAPLPGCCPDCGCAEIDHERDAEQFQLDVPEIRPTLTRFTVAIGRCRACKRRVQGRHPEQTSDALGAAGSQLGPNLKAWGMWLHYRMGLSFGRVAEVLAHLGINVTAGAICQSSAKAASRELVPVHAELVRVANSSKTITMDESGWHVGGWGEWLWVAANDEVTLCWVADGRGFSQATECIAADYSGVLVRDGYVVYDHYDKATHQSCVAHLQRRAREMEADLPRQHRAIPIAAKSILADALAARDLESPAERAAAAVELRARLDALCARPPGCDDNRRLLGHLANQAPHLFTFLTIDGVPATNFRGEQAVRPCAVNRKVWGGNRTWAGADTYGVIVSVLATAAKNGIDGLDYLAARARSPDPGLAILLG
ncbi:MAG: IS66 family transposase [Actinomycetota bacterium]|nr:IS66 family transposase [Actinomycetota bacterium]